MQTTFRYLTPLIGAVGVAAAILFAPAAIAEPEPPPPPLIPGCVDTGGAAALGGSTTECATPGNVQINATPAVVEPYPWTEDWYGPALAGWGYG